MEPTNWAPEHSDALREYLAHRLSFLEVARAINQKFKTAYSRNAVLGRAKRMGLAGQKKLELPARATPSLNGLGESRSVQPITPRFLWPLPAIERTETPRLRCVEIEPRHLSVVDLDRADCRYPYGGDEEGEAITFCGHPCQPGSSYCTPHFHLSRGPGTPSERVAHIVLLRVIEAECVRQGRPSG
jgi:GcrA cell cycle regulator